MRSDIDERGIRKLARDPGVGEVLYRYAAIARNIAKVDAPRKTGAYANSIKAERGGKAYVVAYLVAEDRKSYFLETGSHDKHGGWGPHRTLINACKKLGMRVVRSESREGTGLI